MVNRWKARVLLVLFVVSPLATVPMVPASANGNCGNYGITWDGALMPTSQYSGRLTGDKAFISVGGATLCQNDSYLLGSSWAWAAFGNYNTGGIEQAGYVKWHTGSGVETDFFIEWGANSNSYIPPDTFSSIPGLGSPNVGDTFKFIVERYVEKGGNADVRLTVCDSSGSNCYRMAEAPDPYQDWGWGGNTQAVNQGEAHDPQTDIPGTPSNPADFNTMRIGVDDTWQGAINYTQCSGTSPQGNGNCGGLGGTRYCFAWVNNPPRDHFHAYTQGPNGC